MKKQFALCLIILISLLSPAYALNGPPMYGTSYDGLPFVRFDTEATRTCAEGVIKWNADDKTMDICTENSEVTIQTGQEMHVRGTNKTGTTLTNGEVVFINGAQGNRPTFALANATAEDSSSKVIGIVTADILDNETGYVTTTGLVRDIPTNTMAVGNTVWLATTPGDYTDEMPDTPNHAVSIGIVTRSSASEGVIYVTTINGFELWELHDVASVVQNAVTNDTLAHDGTAWTNVPVTYGQNIFHSAGGSSLDISTTTAIVNITGLTEDIFNNVILNGTDGSIEIIDTGPYNCSFTPSHKSATPADFDHHIGVNGVDQDPCHSNRTIATGTQAGGVPISCYLELTAGDLITGMVNSINSETIEYESINFGCDRIK